VKMAEENEMVILRLYECEKTATRTRIEFAPWVDKVWITDMLEEKDIELPLIDNIAEVDFRTFEIKTLKIQGS
ncbi:MAG: glycosyl hydrolase-related protein, partial [Oscillospiraceae bacterium]